MTTTTTMTKEIVEVTSAMKERTALATRMSVALTYTAAAVTQQKNNYTNRFHRENNVTNYITILRG